MVSCTRVLNRAFTSWQLRGLVLREDEGVGPESRQRRAQRRRACGEVHAERGPESRGDLDLARWVGELRNRVRMVQLQEPLQSKQLIWTVWSAIALFLALVRIVVVR